MPQAIVDTLQVVEIGEENTHRALRARRLLGRLVSDEAEPVSVVEAGEAVEERQLLELLFGVLENGDIHSRPHDLDHVA